jgi:hypothetical protein
LWFVIEHELLHFLIVSAAEITASVPSKLTTSNASLAIFETIQKLGSYFALSSKSTVKVATLPLTVTFHSPS